MTCVEGAQILVVDDDPATVSMVRDYLEQHGAAVTTTTDPEAALERIDGDRFTCVISDYDMPEMDGIELLETVRNRHGHLPFVLYTSEGDDAVARQAREHDATLVKKAGSGRPLATLAEQVPA